MPDPIDDTLAAPPAADALDRTADLTAPPAGPPPAGDRPAVPGYEILAELGRGGMGVVYRARQHALNREVALKVVLSGAHASADQLVRFLAEAETAARLRHQGIVQIHESGRAGGLPFFSMEFVDGGSLADRLAAGRLPPDEAARLVRELAEAVAHAHECGIVHRDLKPANILLTADARPKVTDFGLARRLEAGAGLTRTGAVLGTPSYMAPEQARGETAAAGPAADVYSIGAVLYECLTGRPPFTGKTTADTLSQVLNQPPPSARSVAAAVPRDLETVALKCLEKEPGKRYPTALAVADELRRWQDGRPITARRIGPVGKTVRWAKRNPAVAGLLAAVFGLLTAVSVVSVLAAVRIDDARRDAEDAAGREGAAKEDAVREARAAADARDAADRSAADARQRLVRLYVSTGTTAQDAGDPAAALLWFHRAWERDAADPAADAAHRDRLGGALAELPELLGVGFHGTRVCDAVFSPDGTRVLTRTDGDEAIVWDYAACTPAAPPLKHAGRIRHVCYGPSGKEVATASADGTAGVWDAATGKRRLTLKHAGPLTWVAFHPDGKRLLTTGEDKAVRLWDVAAGDPLDWKLPTDAVIDHAEFSADGTRLVTAGRDSTVRVWRVDPPAAVGEPLPYRPSDDRERYQFNYDRWPRFLPGGGVLSFHERELLVWAADAPPRRLAVPFFPIEVYPLPGGRALVTGNSPTGLVVGLADGKPVARLTHPRNANIGGVSPDGTSLLTASSGGGVHLWAADGRPPHPPHRCGDFCSAVRFSPDGSKYLAASQDGTVRVWAAARRTRPPAGYAFDCGRANTLIWLPAEPAGVKRAYAPDGRRWAEWLAGGSARLFPAGAAGPAVPVPHPAAVDGIKWCDGGGRFVVTGGGTARAWEADGRPAGPGVPVATDRHKVDEPHLSRDGGRLAAWDDDKTVSVWDLVAGRRVLGPAAGPDPGAVVFGGGDTAGVVQGLALSPDGRRLAAVCPAGGTLTGWEVDAGRVAHHHRRFQGSVYVMRYSADGRQVLTYTSDNKARLWDAATGEPAGPAVRQPNTAQGCDVAPDGRRLAVVDTPADGVRVWDAVRGERVCTLPLAGRRPAVLWFAADGRRLSAMIGNRSYTFPLPRHDLPAADTGRLLRFLTGQQIDDTDGIEFVSQTAFRTDPAGYRRLVRGWKGLPPD